MESWAQVCSGVATAALLVSSGARCALLRLGEGQAHRLENKLVRGWRAGALFGVGALLLSAVVRGVAGTLLSSVAGRAGVVALVAALLSVGFGLRNPTRLGQPSTGWAGSILLAVVAGISAGAWPARDSPAPLLLVCTLVTAGCGLWAAGHGLDALTEGRNVDRWRARIAFAALTLNVAVVAGVNWRVWGTPGGVAVASPGSQDGFLNLLVAWLINAAGLVWGRRSVRLAAVLELVVAALLVGIALTVQWTLPFS